MVLRESLALLAADYVLTGTGGFLLQVIARTVLAAQSQTLT